MVFAFGGGPGTGRVDIDWGGMSGKGPGCWKSSLFFTFQGRTHGVWRFPGQGLNQSHICDLHHIHSVAGSLTHWVRPGIKPASSWILTGFVSATPPQELLEILNLESGCSHVDTHRPKTFLSCALKMSPLCTLCQSALVLGDRRLTHPDVSILDNLSPL